LIVRQADPNKCLIGESLLSRSLKVHSTHSFKSTVLECYRRKFGTKADRKFYNSPSNHESEWKKMFFSLSLLHAAVRSRLSISNGWKMPFNFEFQDLDNSFRWIRMELDGSDSLCFQTIQTTLRECVYGSRILAEQD